MLSEKWNYVSQNLSVWIRLFMFAWSTINASLILLGQMNAAAIQTVIIIYILSQREAKNSRPFLWSNERYNKSELADKPSFPWKHQKRETSAEIKSSLYERDVFFLNPVGIPAIWDVVVGVAPGLQCPWGCSAWPSRALSDDQGPW